MCSITTAHASFLIVCYMEQRRHGGLLLSPPTRLEVPFMFRGRRDNLNHEVAIRPKCETLGIFE